ncbi:MAG: biopolymer transporter ExbD [Gammaproteobacteria bacterium]|nr:biopolymer transporter ExbD [Gammaproteobacteria bacterium]NNF48630.1 biopolymer transporter ExbD [Woeseiaceae bacterium]MBT8094172.1 biopolymer transporter ExbD [Gammaproteobacteria bacterium]MBT8105072.1 biopolymer transporter ExbD [Gammaproteobacteria bacterium]NNK25086.1 biopolymer transporter ExbD [Woeseiaceae bacterium]
MRKKSLHFEEEENEINLTPMLDVVFIMLIFFIVTATFIKEAGIQVERPDTTTADSQDDAAILIAISPNDEIWIDRKERDPRAVRGVIERLHAENPKGSIVIQADEGSTHETLVVVMEAAKAAGVTNVAIATDDE